MKRDWILDSHRVPVAKMIGEEHQRSLITPDWTW